MAENYIVKDTKRIVASDGQFSFKSEMNKDLQRVRNTIMTDGEVSILGTGNYIANSVKKTTISGSNNFVSADADITGSDNKVDSNAIVIGDRNIISQDAKKSLIIGNDIVANKSNTVYLDNLVIPNGGTLNGNSFISNKKYIFRLNYNWEVFDSQAYNLVYTNDISANVFSYSVDSPMEGAGRLSFNLTSDKPIFGDRTVVKSTLVEGKITFFDEFGGVSYWDADIPFSSKKIDEYNIQLSTYSDVILPFSIPEMFEYMGVTHTPTSYQLYSLIADIDIDVYDPVPSVPKDLIFGSFSGNISSVYGLSYSTETGLISFDFIPPFSGPGSASDLQLEITQLYSSAVETNTITMKINDVIKQVDDYITYYGTLMTYSPIEVGTYKWFMNSNPLYSATYSLTIGSVIFHGSINYEAIPTPLNLNIIDWDTATGDIEVDTVGIYMNLMTDTLVVGNVVAPFPLINNLILTVNDISDLSVKPDFNVYIFRKIGTETPQLYTSYMNRNGTFTIDIPENYMGYNFYGDWTFFIESELGTLFNATLVVDGPSGFYGEASYNIP